ncbi:MAG: hypothetical protein JWM11_4159 [Planctomycetaceae bacterium]|nr:hypothetical protein [Planctomycetaceae bacterium]
MSLVPNLSPRSNVSFFTVCGIKQMPLPSSDPAEAPRGLHGDLQRAKAGSIATTAELREFVQNLRGKSPQEVLGAVANSGLVQGVAISTLGTFLLMAVFTAGPYFMYGKPAPKAKAEKPAEVSSVDKDAAKPAAADSKAANSPDAKANVQKTLDKMGESETKMADPKVNPLDKVVDDLLDTKK